jgi:hypothetical protein
MAPNGDHFPWLHPQFFDQAPMLMSPAFVLTLIALGSPRKVDQLIRILIVTSVVLVAFLIWQVRWYGWGQPIESLAVERASGVGDQLG